MLILTQLGYLLQGILASPIFFFYLFENKLLYKTTLLHTSERSVWSIAERNSPWSCNRAPVKSEDKVYPIFGLGYQVVSVWQMLNYCALIDEQLWHLVTAFYSLLESLLNEHTWCNFCEWSPPIRIILHDFIRYMFAKSPFYSFFLCQYNCVVLCVYLFAWPC